ncbi:MAG: TIGR03016 family PEP-CTERM system-associated outer membrane protein [Alphaproteobacteria bacterium]|nr:TIGR03016 family PEP-CTERM system-associated outer membrane protein [Alphaproteobacteria bacterium]
MTIAAAMSALALPLAAAELPAPVVAPPAVTAPAAEGAASLPPAASASVSAPVGLPTDITPHPWSAFPTTSALPPTTNPHLVPAAEQPPAFAIHPSIATSNSWTDNALLTATNAKSDFITTLTPNLSVSGKSRRVNADLNYNVFYDRYATQSSLTGFRQSGIGTLNAELAEQLLYLDTRASISEQSLQPTGPTTAGARTSPTGTTQVITTTVAPRLQHQFGSVALGELSAAHDETVNQSPGTSSGLSGASGAKAAVSNLGNDSTNRGKLELRGGESFSQLLWDYSSNVSRDTMSSGALNQDTHQLDMEYRLTRPFALLAVVGDDHTHGLGIDSEKYGGPYYSGGGHWTPTPDADIRLGMGQRYAETNLYALASYKLGAETTFRFSRNISVGTDATNAVDNLNAIQRDSQGNFINPFSGLTTDPAAQPFARSNSAYRLENTTVSLQRQALRDTLGLNGTLSKQDILSSTSSLPTGATTVPLSSSTSVVTVGFSWSHLLTGALTSNVNASLSDVTEAALPSAKTQHYSAGIGLSYKINPTLTGEANYKFANTYEPTQSSATLPAAQTGNILENTLLVGLRNVF